MSSLSPEQFININKMQPEERFDFAIDTIKEQGFLWGLMGENGWLLLQADDDACLPVWPHETFAESWEKEDFPDCKPEKIPLQDWLELWLPGMQKNGTLLLIFPLSEDEEGIMLTAEELIECFVTDPD